MNCLVNGNFVLLWLGRIISQLGDKFYAIALSLWVLEYTKSPGAMGIYLASTMLPGILLGLFTGPVADRLNKKMILIISDCVRGAVVFGVLFLSLSGMLTFGYIVLSAVLLSLASSFFETSAQSIIPEIVEKESLNKANSLNQMTGGLCSVLGPALGAASVVSFGYDMIFILNAVSFLVSALFEAFLRYEPLKTEKSKTTMFIEISEGFAYLRNRKKVIIIIIIIGVAHFFMGSLNVALPFLAGDLKGNTKQNLGWLEASIGAGLILGAIYVGIRKRVAFGEGKLFLYLISAGFCFAGMGLLLCFGIGIALPYLVILVIAGMMIVNASVFWQTLLQGETPANLTGRVFSLSSLIGNVSLPLAFGVYGVILQGFDLSGVILVSGLCLALVCCILMQIYKKALARGAVQV